MQRARGETPGSRLMHSLLKGIVSSGGTNGGIIPNERGEQGQAWGHPELPGEDVEGAPPWVSPSLSPVTCPISPEQSPFCLILFHFPSLFHCPSCAWGPNWSTCIDLTDGGL